MKKLICLIVTLLAITGCKSHKDPDNYGLINDIEDYKLVEVYGENEAEAMISQAQANLFKQNDVEIDTTAYAYDNKELSSKTHSITKAKLNLDSGDSYLIKYQDMLLGEESKVNTYLADNKVVIKDDESITYKHEFTTLLEYQIYLKTYIPQGFWTTSASAELTIMKAGKLKNNDILIQVSNQDNLVERYIINNEKIIFYSSIINQQYYVESTYKYQALTLEIPNWFHEVEFGNE